MASMTFKAFSDINRKRSAEYKRCDSALWNGADWANAMQGEAGEAGNIVKKLRRIETGAPYATSDDDQMLLEEALGKEIGDVYAYLDLLAEYYGLDIERCIIDKFNEVSSREGMPHMIVTFTDSALKSDSSMRSWEDMVE